MKELKEAKKRLSARLAKAIRAGRLAEERQAIDRETARWWAKEEAVKVRRKAK